MAKAALAPKDVNLEFALDEFLSVLVLLAPLKSEHSALSIRLDATVFLACAQHSPFPQQQSLSLLF